MCVRSLGALFEGERIRHADSPCGASAYARTKKLHICKCNFVTERRVYLRESCHEVTEGVTPTVAALPRHLPQ